MTVLVQGYSVCYSLSPRRPLANVKLASYPGVRSPGYEANVEWVSLDGELVSKLLSSIFY